MAMPIVLRSHSHLAVVDPQPSGYHGLAALVEQHRWCVHFLTTARAALRFSWSTPPALWIIHTWLPDMAGLDLCDMLRQRDKQSLVLIISDQCEAEDERRACRLGATSYLCGGPQLVLEYVRALTDSTATAVSDLAPGPQSHAIATRRRQMVRPP